MSMTVGLRPVAEVLPGGMRVLAARTGTIPAVTFNLAFPAGSAHDPEDRGGLAYVLSRVVDRGTRTRSAASIAEALDLRGVSLRVGVNRQLLTVGGTCLIGDLTDVLELVAEIVQHPSFPAAELETRRTEVVTAIRQDQDSPAAMALERLMPLLYGTSHPYGRPSKGTVEAVTHVTRDDLLGFHRTWVVPSSASLVIVGDVSPGDVMEVVGRIFGSWAEPEGLGADHSPAGTPLTLPARVTARRRVVVPMMNKAQADVAYGFVTVTRDDPAYYAYWLLANIFGQYGMGGRLGQSIRERQGMAYYAFCGFEAGLIPGPLVVRAGVHADNVDRTIESIDREVAALSDRGVTADEVADSKRYLIGSLPRTLETNAGIAAFLQNVQQFGLGLDYDLRLPGLIGAVTREAINEAATSSLAVDRAALVVAGPYQEQRAS